MENQVSKAELLVQAHAASISPGVYLMKDVQGEILYIGKAKSLKSRLASYFQPAGPENPRTQLLVSKITRFELILTGTEEEALILEATLIKRHKPRFNVRLKDDKAYPYLRIQMNEPFPRVDYVRRAASDGARYFGPFPSGWAARQVQSLLNETFRLRDCSDNTFRHRSRPCILYQIGKCTGPCVGLIQESQYHERLHDVIAVLEGKPNSLVSALREGMEEASREEEYERAAEFRDQLRNLELVTQTQVAVEAGSERDRDVVGIARKDQLSQGTLLKIREGKIVSVKHYSLHNVDPSLPMARILADFLSQHYLLGAQADREGDEGAQEVWVPEAPEDGELLNRVFDAEGVRVRWSPPPGEEGAVVARLLDVARTNAEYALEENARKMAREGAHGMDALEEVREKLHLPKLPHRIECYDISNTQGQDAVASRVVFIDGAPDKNLYRRYKIRTVEGANDFAMMREVLGRRFSRGEEALPDLLVVDGGKGQLAQAVAILDELSVQGVSVVGLAKARVESDFKSSEVKSSQERIFIPNRKNPIPLLPHTAAYKLLTHVRDEAHRFAVSYHRLLRKKRVIDSR